MTLRFRIAAAAGIAVALTAIVLACGDYAGTRSTLRHQIDSALTSRAASVQPRGAGGSGRPVISTPPSRYGDASGFVQQVSADGTVEQGDPDDTGTLPVDARARATAKTGTGRNINTVAKLAELAAL